MPFAIRPARTLGAALGLLVAFTMHAAAAPPGSAGQRVVYEGTVAVAVEDDGPGFAPEAIASLGEPFTTTKPGGTGLGLAICLRIAEDHEGRLTAENRPGGGARVTLTLPAA